MLLAIFDLDHTILEGDSDSSWLFFLAENKIIAEKEVMKKNEQFYRSYCAGNLNFDEYAQFAFSIIQKIPYTRLKTLRRLFFKNKVLPMIRPNARKSIQEHQQQGHKVIISTATNDFISYPVVKYLKADDLLATRLERSEEGFTGKYRGVPNFREGKVTNLLEWLKRNNEYQLATTYFYSDSINDLPLLSKVGYPRIVNGDEDLCREGEKRGWTMMDFRMDFRAR